MVKFNYFFLLIFILSCQSTNKKTITYKPSEKDLIKAESIAVDVAKLLEYKTGKIDKENQGQCGTYALMFVLKYNEYVGENVARLIIANNPIDSGIYKVGKKVNVAEQGFHGFSSGGSGILSWDGQLYLYHPINGAYQIFIERKWIPKKHFGVNMLDKRQVHVWASIGNISIDPTYYDVWPDQFKSPLGKDE